MDRAKQIRQAAQCPEDVVLFSRVLEQMERAEDRGRPAVSCFLTEREQALLEGLLGTASSVRFFGGYDRAERRMAVWLPEWEDPEAFLNGADSPITLIRASWYEKDTLTHRDLLGGLMGCGIKREMLGDILVGEGTADILAASGMARYLLDNFLSAGRTQLQTTGLPLSELRIPAPKIKIIHDTLASLRLDSAVSSGFSLARAKAAALIDAGRCSLNRLPCEKPDHPVAEGDVISVRGLGKCVLSAVGGSTKKGRISIEITKYL